MVFGRGSKDMTYAVFARAKDDHRSLAERHPGYGAGAVEAANEVLREERHHVAAIKPTVSIDAQLVAARKATAAAKAAYEKAMAYEKALKEKKKKQALLEEPRVSTKERDKAEKMARRERALKAKGTGAVAAAQRPRGVQKVQVVGRSRATVSAEKNKK
ncbi:hypothetical protein N0V90_008439 [Kalmusia sp. IMI 367209]|nr:hypothetical protein N0V90_008439 [Kalmusia sp. IMI 367209]